MENKYFRAFDEGKIKEFILGEGEYYLFDRDGPGHNMSIIFSYLGEWANTSTKKNLIEKVFYEILNEYEKMDNFYQFIYTYIIYSYYKESSNEEFLNKKKLIKKTKMFISRDIKEILKDEETIKIIIPMQKHLLNDMLFDNKILLQKLQESFLKDDFLRNVKTINKSEL